MARLVRARGDLRGRLDAMYRDHPERHPVARDQQRDGAPGDDPARGVHARPRPAVHRHRRLVRPCAGRAPTARPPRPHGLAHRRAARGADRGRDGVRLVEPAAAVLQLHHVRLTGMSETRPEFSHQPPKHGLVGPFSGRQLLAAALAVVLVAVLLIVVTTPLGATGLQPNSVNPQATPYLLSSPPPNGLAAGATAPELAFQRPDGSAFQLTDLDGKPIRLDELRGKVVWLNFFASWCPPCEQETPILRTLSNRYRDQGVEIVGVSVQETSPSDLAAYRSRYQLPYTIGFDGRGDALRTYKVFALPTQFFIDQDGVIVQVVNGPVDEAGATALIEGLLGIASPAPSGSAAP